MEAITAAAIPRARSRTWSRNPTRRSMPSESTRRRTLEESAGPGLLTDVSEPTGGRHFFVENLNELPDVAAKIGIELRNQYVLGYSPTNQTRDGKYRKVNVKLG